ncbi:MAG: radical SAM protein [Treponemataceae bacterium]|nr:radical SAM protein [Treponemataceae bacterium]
MTSRGCPFRCSYCASHVLFSGFLQRAPVDIYDELVHWHRRMGVCNFSFYDDAFLINSPRMAIPLLRMIERFHPDFRFHCPNGIHLRALTPEIARLFKVTGFQTLRFGFETADVRRQWDTGGKVFTEELLQGVSYLREAGYTGPEIGVYCLCGLPGQTAEEVFATVRYVKELGARPIIAEYSPIPQTALWEEAKAASPYPLEKEPLYHNNTLLPCRDVTLDEKTYREIKTFTRTQ